tara:strand:+ start:1400 stop:1933 length:534 start_codon:yes stop_codon:yes gene_type:complete
MTIITDLLKDSLDGDIVANNKIYEKSYPIVFKACMRYSPSFEDGQDWVQEVFVKIFNDLKSFKGTTYKELRPWVKKIASNYCIDRYRGKSIKVNKNIDVEFCGINDDEVINTPYNLSDIIRGIEVLPKKYKKVFNLYMLDGLNHKEIENKLKLKPGSSTSLLYKAKRRLREILKDNI